MDRLLEILKTPGWQRTLLLRRTGAGFLIVVAVFSAMGQAQPSDNSLVVMTQTVTPGSTLTEDCLTLTPVPDDLTPDSAYQSISDVTGLVVATTLEPGEIVTPHKVVAPSHQQAGFDLVPLALANPDIIPVLRHGDRVSIIAARKPGVPQDPVSLTPDAQAHGTQQAEPSASDVIASNATVVVAAPQTKDSPETLLVELPHDLAAQVAAIGLNTQLTVVISGGRG